MILFSFFFPVSHTHAVCTNAHTHTHIKKKKKNGGTNSLHQLVKPQPSKPWLKFLKCHSKASKRTVEISIALIISLFPTLSQPSSSSFCPNPTSLQLHMLEVKTDGYFKLAEVGFAKTASCSTRLWLGWGKRGWHWWKRRANRHQGAPCTVGESFRNAPFSLTPKWGCVLCHYSFCLLSSTATLVLTMAKGCCVPFNTCNPHGCWSWTKFYSNFSQ